MCTLLKLPMYFFYQYDSHNILNYTNNTINNNSIRNTFLVSIVNGKKGKWNNHPLLFY